MPTNIELYNSIADGNLKAIDTSVIASGINEKHVNDQTILEFVCIKNEYKLNEGDLAKEKDKETEKIIKALIDKGADPSQCPEYKASWWSRLTGRGGKRKTRRHKSRKSRRR